MIKKVFIIVAAIITMMMACAGPIMTRVHAADDFPSDWQSFMYWIESSPDNWTNYKYIYFNYRVSYNGQEHKYCAYFYANDYSTDKFYVEFSNNILVVRALNGYVLNSMISFDSYRNHYFSRSVKALQFDFNNNTMYAVDEDANYVDIVGQDVDYSSFLFYNFDTNFEEYYPKANSLSLDVSFKPTLSGTISRKQTIDGKDYISKTLDMIIKNNGSNAQFAMFIVNKGENITFPESSLQNNQGFEGNPVYCYVSDEWSSFTVGLLGSAVYAPCAWHTIAAGYNQTYSIYWEQISLEANHEYDVVVYGCVNDQAIQTNTSTQWEMRPVYTVTSSLDDVKEVYRSTFTISDPAEFNPNFIDEGGSVHPWNPNSDNSGLFNASSAYRDDNGNIVIKGQTSNGGFNVFSDFSGISVQNMNVNNVFGDTFKFFTSILGFFPPVWIALITVGLSAIVTIAIIKKVT